MSATTTDRVRQRTPSPSVARSGGRRADETARLLREASNSDEPLRTQLQDGVIELNLEVAQSIARRYRDRGESPDDLEQAASVGLVKAVRRFDPSYGKDFLSFAVPTITGEVRRHFRDTAWTVRPPRRVQELQARISGVWADLVSSLGHEPTVAETAAHLQETEEHVIEALSSHGCFRGASLDAPVGTRTGTETFELQHLLGEEDGNFDLAETVLDLEPALDDLDERDRLVLRLHVHQGWSQDRIAGELGVSQMQVSRLLSRIRSRLRTAVS